MIVLGITDGDDGGACIVKDGVFAAAVNEERLNRKKQVIGFPLLSIREVLRLSGVDSSEVDGVAVAGISEKFHPTAIDNNGWFRTKEHLGKRIRDHMASALSPYLGTYTFPKKLYHGMRVRINQERRLGIPRLLKQLGVEAPIRYYNHHLCHALSAYHTSGFNSALTITLDGGGDGASSHIYLTQGRSFRRLVSLDSFHSIGNFYAYVTHICGFKASIHEGKITGLAAYGEPTYKDVFSRLISYHRGEIVNIGSLYRWAAIREIQRMLPSSFKQEDLAASIQAVLEDIAIRYFDYWIRQSGANKLALAGGVFANVKLNQRIAKIPGVEEIYVFPQMGDGGLAVGAAYALYRGNGEMENGVSRIEDVYLGPEYSNHEIRDELLKRDLPYKYYGDIEREIAKLLAAGKVVARFNGKMEYGPRALGNRSILYQPTDPTVNDWLNKRLKRTEFMPFAPAVISEYSGQCFNMIHTAAYAAKFMTVTFDCTNWMRRNCSAVVHVDGTARPQLVDKETNPSFYRIIDEYRKITGLPCIINTSFNMHEEPIVCSPQDAVSAFMEGQLDYLAIGSFLVQGEPCY